MDIDRKRHTFSKVLRRLKQANLSRVKVRIHRSRLKLKLYSHDGSTRDVVTSLPLNPPEYSMVISDEKSQTEYDDDELFDECDDKGVLGNITTDDTTTVTVGITSTPPTLLIPASDPRRSSSPSPSYTAASVEYVPVYGGAKTTRANINSNKNNYYNTTTTAAAAAAGFHTRNKSVSPVRDNGRPLILFKSQVNVPVRKSHSPEPPTSERVTSTSETNIKASDNNSKSRVSSRTIKLMVRNHTLVVKHGVWFRRLQYGVIVYLFYVILFG